MGKKRKSVETTLDEVDRNMYGSFCTAANSLSQLYSQAMSHQKLAFQAGERHGLEKLYQWILREQERGSRVLTMDILNYMQNELDHGSEEPTMSPREPAQNQHSESPMQFTNTEFVVSSGSSCQSTGQGDRFGNNVLPSGTGARSDKQPNQDSEPSGANDSSMDMHAD